MILKFLSYGYSVASTMLAKLSFHVVSFFHECMHTNSNNITMQLQVFMHNTV